VSRPFINDPDHLRLLDGQRYVVLRATGPIRAAYVQVQGLVRETLADLDVSYPAEPHLTLLGLAAGTGLEAVRGLVSDWARDVPPLELEIEKVSVFPSPFQIVIVQIRKNPTLFGAMSRLRERAHQQGLVDLADIAPNDWIFHLSVACCSSLNTASWGDASRAVNELVVPAAKAVASDAEIVAFDNGQESSVGVVPFTGAAVNADGQEDI
jgi:2'-5' RNA ligase